MMSVMGPTEVTRRARKLARAERRSPGALKAALRVVEAELVREGWSAEDARDEALVLLGIGLREGGHVHAEVVARLEPCSSARGAHIAAFHSAAWMHAHRAHFEADHAMRARAIVALFLIFTVWGAVGAELISRLLR